jgi:hypothetical protein
MAKIKVSPTAYKKGVEKYGEQQFSMSFMIDPDHCEHAYDIQKVVETRHEHKGRKKYTIYVICDKCGDQNYGMELWGKP